MRLTLVGALFALVLSLWAGIISVETYHCGSILRMCDNYSGSIARAGERDDGIR